MQAAPASFYGAVDFVGDRRRSRVGVAVAIIISGFASRCPHLISDPLEGCKLPMNRDRLGASNIGFNFCRLFRGEAPMRTMTDEEREFHRLQIGRCMACDAE